MSPVLTQLTMRLPFEARPTMPPAEALLLLVVTVPSKRQFSTVPELVAAMPPT